MQEERIENLNYELSELSGRLSNEMAVGEFLAQELWDVLGTCPGDARGFEHPDGCENVCTVGKEPGCWVLFARAELQAEQDQQEG